MMLPGLPNIQSKKEGLVSQRSVLHRRKLDVSENKPAEVLEALRVKPMAVRLELIQIVHTASP
eukprot:9200117-Pyramimonas_sp.AAC.1